jgi:hypothetical protein
LRGKRDESRGAEGREEKRLGMFIERMERCSKYSRIFLRFASDEVGTDKKRKERN